MPSMIERLEVAQAEQAARDAADPWSLRLKKLRGTVGDDGVERVSTQCVFDYLEVAQRARGSGTCRKLASGMASLGWTAIRLRAPTRGGYLDRCRGFCRP